MQKNSSLVVEVIILMVAVIWGVNTPIMKLGLIDVPPMPYNTVRMVVATLVAWIALWLSGTYRPFAEGDFRKLCKISLLGFFVFQLFFMIGVYHTTSGNAAFTLSLLPVSVLIINRLCHIEKITAPALIGVFLSIGGILLIVVGSGKEFSLAGEHMTGIIFLLIAQAGYGYYTVFSQDLLGKYSTYQISTYLITITTSLFVIVSGPSLLAVNWNAVSLFSWLSALYSGIFGLCIGNFLWIWGTGKIGSTKAAMYNNLSTVFAVLAGYVLLGETFGVLQVLGAAAIFGGIYVTRNRDKFCKNQSVW
jgi:drug/metabolite transporter (DMT)-like permease